MKRFLVVAGVLLVVLLVWRFGQVRIDRLGDIVSLGVLAVVLALEAVIVGGQIFQWHRDPYRQRLAEKRALLELAKQDKARGRRQARGF